MKNHKLKIYFFDEKNFAFVEDEYNKPSSSTANRNN